MKFLNVNATIILKPVFEGDVLKAGTPLALDGSIANSDAAVGLVASDTAKGAESIAVVTEGTIDLSEVAASYGTALTDDCIAALKGITFLYGGKAVVPAGGSGLPDYSEASDGDVLAIENGAPAWKAASGGGGAYLIVTCNTSGVVTDATAADIRAAVTAGIPIFIHWGSAVRLAAAEGVTSSSGYLRSTVIALNVDPMIGTTCTATKWEIRFTNSTVYDCTTTTVYLQPQE